MGMRERKKEETRRALLDKSRVLFGEKGYRSVTTAEIARAAGIAEGTLFNYFRNKGELFIAAAMPEPPAEPVRHPVLERPSASRLAAEIAAMLDRELFRLEHADKRLLRDYFAIVYGGAASDGADARSGLFAADERLTKRIADFLNVQIAAHPSEMASLDAEIASACIAGCAIALISQYILIDEWPYSRFRNDVRDQIRFILAGHVQDRE
ncbi:helix-turn-helix domain-containing protein [Paenibacillaceae bacterium WGS1546]|uniref:helix-turn-helix domain-containing protein n=1 Tax=Cohnella sp. WGS1546 TaxID=3366810 RepID=UPI00372D7D6E